MADRELDDVREELEALQAAFAAEQEKSSALEDEARTAQAALASRLDDTNTSEHVMDRPIFVTPSRRIDKFRGQPLKPGNATIYEWVADARRLLATSQQLPEASKAALLVDNLSGRARQEILGRGNDTSSCPEAIFKVLLTVFGDGDLLPQLQQRFFSYSQREGESLVVCSLSLLELYDRMLQWDPSFEAGKEKALKGRLAEAVRDESLRRELRRLTMESPDLGYFDLRDRAMQWLGNAARPYRNHHDATQYEVKAVNNIDLETLVRQQADQLQQLQQQLKRYMATTQRSEDSSHRKPDGPRLCWLCQSPDHLKVNCPQRRWQPRRGWRPQTQQRMHPSN